MTDKQEEIDIPLWQKVLALGAVVVIAILLFVIGTAIFGRPTDQEAGDRAIQDCGGSRFSYEADCPEPDYDKELYDEVNRYPDNKY